MITGQVISVNYAPQLSLCLPTWLKTLDQVLVVTSSKDAATIELCCSLNVQTLLTDVFWENGASFNKGAGISAGFEFMAPTGWHLFFDADVVPSPTWRDNLRLRRGFIYGAHRRLENGSMIREGELAGSFHLVHCDDPQMKVKPVVDTHWTHAGNYDSTFQCRWPRSHRIKITTVTHIGQPFKNWCGVGNEDELKRVFEERKRLGKWDHETVKSPLR